MNGSPLFTGGAGSGESEIRRWMLENDWVEAIIALPTDLFYNTGIQTYVWLLTNRKDPARRDKVQLIDASGKKMHLFHSLYHGDGRLLATGEYMLLHVDLKTRASCEPAPAVAKKLAEIAALHAKLPAPEGAGRAVGQRR